MIRAQEPIDLTRLNAPSWFIDQIYFVRRWLTHVRRFQRTCAYVRFMRLINGTESCINQAHIYSLLGYLKPVCPKNSSLIRRGLVKRNNTFELPALSLVPLALLPPKDCWPMRAAVVLQSGRDSLLAIKSGVLQGGRIMLKNWTY